MNDDVDAKVLVVEDDRATRVLLTRLIEQLGHGVHAASDGLEALEHLSQRHYEVLLTDLNLPRMHGRALANYVRQAERALPLASRTLIVALTAEGECRKALPFDDVLVKPVSMPTLSMAFERWMSVRANMLACKASGDDLPSAPASRASLPDLDEEIQDMLPAYIEMVSRDIAQLRALGAHALEGTPALEVFGHRLKGSGGSYGLGYLTELGAELELAAQQRETELALSLLAAVESLVQRVARRLSR